MAYELGLPAYTSRLHLVFHVCLLRKHVPPRGGRRKRSPPKSISQATIARSCYCPTSTPSTAPCVPSRRTCGRQWQAPRNGRSLQSIATISLNQYWFKLLKFRK